MPLVDDDGYEVGADGARILVDGEPKRLFLRDQTTFDRALTERLAREKKLTEKRIQDLQAQIEKGGDPGGKLQAKIEELEERHKTDAQRAQEANKELEKRIGTERERGDKAEGRLRNMLLTNSLLTNAGKFINPEDVTALLGPSVVWEDGKDGADPTFKFKVKVKDPKTNAVEDRLFDTTEAIAHLAATRPHLVKGDGTGGSGTRSGGQGGGGTDKPISEMSPRARLAAGFSGAAEKPGAKV